jgi:hypothetical protein
LAGAVQIGYHISVAHHFHAAVSLRHGRSIENSETDTKISLRR